MGTDNRRPARSHFFSRFVYFGLTTVIAVVMLLTALVVWLTDLMGSVIASTLIIGGFSGILAVVIYQLSIRDAVAEIRAQLETVYEVTGLVKTGYEWVVDKLALFMNLRGAQKN